MKRYGLAKRERLTRRADFEATYRERRSAADDALIVYARSSGLAYSRLGLSVAGRFGNSVRRNYFRRLCREAFRLDKHDLPRGFDFIIIPRRRIDLTLSEIRSSLKELLRRLCGPKSEPT